MAEYASIRLRLFCIRATMLPVVMVSTASTHSTIDQSVCTPSRCTRKTRRKAAKAANLTPTAMKAVIEVGAPS